MLKNYRTYITVCLMIVVGVTNYLANHTVFTPEFQAFIQSVLGALAIYFRSQA